MLFELIFSSEYQYQNLYNFIDTKDIFSFNWFSLASLQFFVSFLSLVGAAAGLYFIVTRFLPFMRKTLPTTICIILFFTSVLTTFFVGAYDTQMLTCLSNEKKARLGVDTIVVLDTQIDIKHNSLKGLNIEQRCLNDKGYFDVDCNQECTNTTCTHATAMVKKIADSLADPTKVKFLVYDVLNSQSKEIDTDKINIALAQVSLGVIENSVINRRNNLLAVNLSLNNSHLFEGICDDYNLGFTERVKVLTDYQVPVIASSGNDGGITKRAFPGCVSGVWSVGSLDNGEFDTMRGEVSQFSNGGTDNVDFLDYGAYFELPEYDKIDKDKVDMAFGTSVAASSITAKLRQVNPDLSLLEIKEIIKNSPRD